jgi:hypothetical protein
MKGKNLSEYKFWYYNKITVIRGKFILPRVMNIKKLVIFLRHFEAMVEGGIIYRVILR